MIEGAVVVMRSSRSAWERRERVVVEGMTRVEERGERAGIVCVIM